MIDIKLNPPAKYPRYDRPDDYRLGFESDHTGGIR